MLRPLQTEPNFFFTVSTAVCLLFYHSLLFAYCTRPALPSIVFVVEVGRENLALSTLM